METVMPTSEQITEPVKPKQKYKNIMAELLKPPPKEEKPNVHLSGGGQFSKLDKI
jgi:hypothetical protein